MDSGEMLARSKQHKGDNVRREMIWKLLVGVLAVAVCATFLMRATVAHADDLYAQIRGTVTDTSGSAVAGVTVTVTNINTGISQQQNTQTDGSYIFPQLVIGDYDVKAVKTGFRTFSATKIHLVLNMTYVQDVKLEVGAVAQEVVVEANAVQVESTTAQLGTVVEADEITSLPLVGRDWLQLQALQPGVVSGSDRFGTNGGINFATNGGQSQFDVYVIDGVDTNDLVLNTQTITPSEDSIAEFKEVTSTMDPEFSRSSGGVMNAIIKSGTNSFHGDAFEFYRDTFLNATPEFTGVKSPFQDNVFGGTVGGPVVKNHLFFFASFEGTHVGGPQDSNGVENGIEETTVFEKGQTTGTTPFTDLETSTSKSPFPLKGDNGTTYPAGTAYSTIFSAGTIPTADINSITAKLLPYIPNPNSGTNVYTFNATENQTDYQYMYRIDETFGAKDTIWGTWMNEAETSVEPIPFIGADLPGFGEKDGENFKFLSLSWTHTFNDHLINEARAGYNRFNYAAVFPQSATLPSSLGFNITPQDTAGAGIPVVSVSGLFSLGFSQDGPQPRIDQVYEPADNVTLTEGRHTLKFGFTMERWETYNPFLSNNDGYYQFGTFGSYSTGDPGADFLLGIPALYIQSSGSLEDARARQYYTYFQDAFKLRPNFTLTYGLGWTIDTPSVNKAYDGHGQVAFRPNQQSVIFPGAPIGVVYQGDPGVDSAGPVQWHNLGPRIGFAYSPDWGGVGKTSIRAGYGIYYDKSETEQADQVVGMPPFATSVENGVPGAGATLNGVNPSFANPFKDITGCATPSCTVANPFPFSGYPSNVNFATTPGLEPVFSYCCAGIAANAKDPMGENYNLTIERELPASSVLSIGYVGSVSHHLSQGLPINTVSGLDSMDNPTFLYNENVYGSLDTIFSGGNSNYNSLQVDFKKQMAHGISVHAAYTYSHSLDDTSSFENSSFGTFGSALGGFGGAIRASNPYCYFSGCDYASSSFDARHRLALNWVFTIPGLHSNGFASRLTNGWTITGIAIFQTGFPMDVADLDAPSGGCDLGGDFSCWDGPNQVTPVQYENPRKIETLNEPSTGATAGNYWFNPTAFAPVNCAGENCPAAGVNPTTVAAYGNTRRNPVRGPGINNWNLSLYKDTSINERLKFELRMDASNAFNHLEYDPNSISGNVNSPVFGQVLGALAPRQVQLVGKFFF
jgi:hypothetical protein